MVLGKRTKGSSVVATAKGISEGQAAGGRGYQDSLPSGLTVSLLLLLSMGSWGMEAESVCGEFLWATADMLFDDEILRVSLLSLLQKGELDPPPGSRKSRHTAPDFADQSRSAGTVRIGPRSEALGSSTRLGFHTRWLLLSLVKVYWKGIVVDVFDRQGDRWEGARKCLEHGKGTFIVLVATFVRWVGSLTKGSWSMILHQAQLRGSCALRGCCAGHASPPWLPELRISV